MAGDNTADGLKPSAEAVKNDPLAGSTTVPKGYSRSIGEIHAAYEHLDKNLFPLQPYWKYPSLYVLQDNPQTDWASNSATIFVVGAIEASYKQTNMVGFYGPDELPELVSANGTKIGIHLDDFFRYAYSALVMADPSGYVPLTLFAQLLVYRSPYVSANMQYKIDDQERGVVSSELGLFEPAIGYRNIVLKRELEAMNHIAEHGSIKKLAEVTEMYYLDADKATDDFTKAYNAIAGIELHRILKAHVNYKYNADGLRPLDAFQVKYEKDIPKILSRVRAASVPARELPKAVAVDAETQRQGDIQGRKLAQGRGEEFVRLIFTSDKWQEFKQQEWPYRVTSLVLPCVLVTRAGGKDYMLDCSLQKSPGGGA